MPFGKGSGMKWDAVAEAQLFKCVLEVHDIKPDYKKLEEKMRAAGYECTAKAITHRIGNIRHKLTAANTNSDNAATPDSTPKKSGAKDKKSAAKDSPAKTVKASNKRKRTPEEQEASEASGEEYAKEDGEEDAKVGKKVKVEEVEEEV
ncbi:MAG: hypothetical protein Q9225_005883 [Loekoesia sp. 1 TL-2023]